MKPVTYFFKGLALLLAVGLLTACSQPQNKEVFTVKLNRSWKIQSSDSILVKGDKISLPGLNTGNWYAAACPTTVFNALVKNGLYKNIFVDENLNKISSEPFKTSWWYRTTFVYNKKDEHILLRFDGINYKANVWLNGILIADTAQVKNPFRMFSFDITSHLAQGENVLALEVFPPVKGDFSIGFVDWNPPAPDGEMGVTRPVWLDINNGVGVNRLFVVATPDDNLKTARLTASVEVTNYEEVDLLGEAVLKINGIKLIKPVELLAGQTKKVLFTPDEFQQLVLQNPKIWWPATLGKPNQYKATFEFHDSGRVLDEKSVKFGIRSISSYYTNEGHRGFKINGKKILIRGGGWVDRLLLDDTRESILSQLEYVRDMNLNTIRLEGFWGNNQTLYNLCDSLGILVMAGWSCHWEWEDYLGIACSEKYGGIQKPADVDMMSSAWQDQVIWLRNHPSVFAWLGGSDCIPNPQLEQRYLETFTRFDSTRVFLASAKEWDTPNGNTSVKMRGPYAYEPPVYWFSDTLYGGAFGFNTETSPGAQVPPLESIRNMLTESHRWPIDSVWNFHCGRNEFNNLNLYTTALEARYGKALSVADYAKKAQLMNYELMRPMFEAFSVNRYETTGVIQWMLNSAWPEMYWQLYDYYLMPNGAYFGAKKASQPYHCVYDPAKRWIYAVNDRLEDLSACKVKIRAYDKNSSLKFEKELKTGLQANSSKKLLRLPLFKWNNDVCFLDLRLMDSTDKEVDNNFYWVSARKDILDYEAKPPSWYFHTPVKQYADFTALNRLPKVKITASMVKKPSGTKTRFLVTIVNPSSKIAFFIHAKIADKKTGNTILPVLWSDNYVSLVPGEKRILTASVKNSNLKNKTPFLKIEAYNE